MKVKEHEKFISFCLLGGALVGLVVFMLLHPLPKDDTSTQQAVVAVIGALTLAFGGAANALFRISDQVTVSNTPKEPIPVEPTQTAAEPNSTGELSEEEKINA